MKKTMAAPNRHNLEGCRPMYSYAAVERTLALVFRVGDDGLGKLQARVKNYIRIKFTPQQPGKGTNIDYTHENIVQWAVALQLQEFGLEPTQIQKQLEPHWSAIFEHAHNQDPAVDVVLTFNPALMNDMNRDIAFIRMREFLALAQDGWRGAICVNLGHLGREVEGAVETSSSQIALSGNRARKGAKARAAAIS